MSSFWRATIRALSPTCHAAKPSKASASTETDTAIAIQRRDLASARGGTPATRDGGSVFDTGGLAAAGRVEIRGRVIGRCRRGVGIIPVGAGTAMLRSGITTARATVGGLVRGFPLTTGPEAAGGSPWGMTEGSKWGAVRAGRDRSSSVGSVCLLEESGASDRKLDPSWSPPPSSCSAVSGTGSGPIPGSDPESSAASTAAAPERGPSPPSSRPSAVWSDSSANEGAGSATSTVFGRTMTSPGSSSRRSGASS